MSRFWPFRSLPNFLLSVVGVSGASFYGYGVYQQQYFQNPVVAEAVKVLGKNQKVKQMIGYPMSYQSSTKNKFNQTGNQLYFSFKVMGPRGATEVEVTATQMKAKDVYEYDNEVLPIKAAEAKYEELNKQLTLLQKEPIAKTNSISSWFKGNKQKQGYVSSDVLLRKQKQVEQAKRAVDQLINERKTRKNQYFIPQQQYYSQIVSQKGKDNSNYLPENALLYKLQNVACQLPNKSRINVLNSGKAYKAEDYETKIDEKNHFNDLRKPLYGPLHQKLSINVAELSDQEIDQYSKHKTNFMYQKYNQYRVLAFMVFMIGSGAIFLYILKNKTKSMSNSVLYQLASLKLSKHNKIGQFLKKNGIKQMQLDKNVAGGMKNNVFKCQIAVNNVTMGKLQIEGKHNAKAGSYDYDKFIFRYVQNNQHKQIDLLK